MPNSLLDEFLKKKLREGAPKYFGDFVERHAQEIAKIEPANASEQCTELVRRHAVELGEAILRSAFSALDLELLDEGPKTQESRGPVLSTTPSPRPHNKLDLSPFPHCVAPKCREPHRGPRYGFTCRDHSNAAKEEKAKWRVDFQATLPGATARASTAARKESPTGRLAYLHCVAPDCDKPHGGPASGWTCKEHQAASTKPQRMEWRRAYQARERKKRGLPPIAPTAHRIGISGERRQDKAAFASDLIILQYLSEMERSAEQRGESVTITLSDILEATQFEKRYLQGRLWRLRKTSYVATQGSTRSATYSITPAGWQYYCDHQTAQTSAPTASP